MRSKLWKPQLSNYFESLKAKSSSVYRLRYFRKWSIVAGLTGTLAGLGAIAFNYILLKSIYFFQNAKEVLPSPWLIVLIPAFGGLMCGIIKYVFTPESFEKSCGTDAMIDAVHSENGKVKTRMPFITLLTASLTIGSGGSCGRESPTAYIGMGFGSITWDIIKKLKLEKIFNFTLDKADRKIIAICGASSGLGAIFRAPLGGAIFNTEVLYIYGMELEGIYPAIISSITSYLLFSLAYGFEPLFKVATSWIFNFPDLFFCIIAGFIASLIGIIYIKVFFSTFHLFRASKLPDYLKPAIGGLLMGLIVLRFPEVWGMGYETIQKVINNEIVFWSILILIIAKILATSFTVGSGGTGGLIAPSIFIGALIGGALGMIYQSLFPGIATHYTLYVVIGMGAFYAAIGKVPLSFTLMLCEALRNFSIILPLSAACTAGYLISGYFTIYESQHADSTKEKQDVLRNLFAYEVMQEKVETISSNLTIMDSLKKFGTSTYKSFPVVENNVLMGIVTYDDVRAIPYNKRNEVLVSDVMTKDIIYIFPEDTARTALDSISQKGVGRVLVVDPEDNKKLLGIVTRTDIVDAYEKLLIG